MGIATYRDNSPITIKQLRQLHKHNGHTTSAHRHMSGKSNINKKRKTEYHNTIVIKNTNTT